MRCQLAWSAPQGLALLPNCCNLARCTLTLPCCLPRPQDLVDYLRAPGGVGAGTGKARGADFSHGGGMRSAFATQTSDNGRKLSGFPLGAPVAVNGGGLHTRPSYMGEVPPPAQLPYHNGGGGRASGLGLQYPFS